VRHVAQIFLANDFIYSVRRNHPKNVSLNSLNFLFGLDLSIYTQRLKNVRLAAAQFFCLMTLFINLDVNTKKNVREIRLISTTNQGVS
jgi:hypothetical protein